MIRRKHYLGGALSEEESKEFIAKYNKIKERICIKCGKSFESEGAHNQKCPVCKGKEVNQSTKIMGRDILVYKYSDAFTRTPVSKREIESNF